jgi:D-lactate dehydrogenase
MKVIAYNIQSCERGYLATANQKKHDITLIGNQLTKETLFYATGKEAIIIQDDMEISAELVTKLALMGINHVIVRETCNNESELNKIQNMATKVIRRLDLLVHLP